MPHYEVGAEPPDHTLDRICWAGLEAGEAYQRISRSPQLLGDIGGGGGFAPPQLTIYDLRDPGLTRSRVDNKQYNTPDLTTHDLTTHATGPPA